VNGFSIARISRVVAFCSVILVMHDPFDIGNGDERLRVFRIVPFGEVLAHLGNNIRQLCPFVYGFFGVEMLRGFAWRFVL
jgi:hypothetical protein